jgi:uncharacterized protein YbaR (Trm112 family)
MPLLDPRLQVLLICPACGGELNENDTDSLLRCRTCQTPYPVREFPVMKPETTTVQRTPQRRGVISF